MENFQGESNGERTGKSSGLMLRGGLVVMLVGLCAGSVAYFQKDSELAEVVDERSGLEVEMHENEMSRRGQVKRLEGELEKMRGEVIAANRLAEKARSEVEQWRAPMKETLDTVQDVYAMKVGANSQVLREMENHSARSVEILKKWEGLCELLSKRGGYAREVALLRVRMAEGYASAGILSKVDLVNIDWKAAGLEARAPDIATRVYFTATNGLLAAGKGDVALKYLDKCKVAAANIKSSEENKLYARAMISLLEGQLAVSKEPTVALKHYLSAIEDLRKVVVAMPKNVPMRMAFAQACMDGSMLTEVGENAGLGEKLRKEAHSHAYWLAKRNPEVKLPHILSAEIDIVLAEEQLRGGERGMVGPLLERAEASLKLAGGDVLLESAIKGVRAFIVWDLGKRKEAREMIDGAIERVERLTREEPANVDARYRLASLIWERSSMHVSPSDAIKDGRAAAVILIDLVRSGAGKREAGSRRMIAIIYGDIGHLAASVGENALAKQYFEQALGQWKYLMEKWGKSDEYEEGARYSAWRIKGL